MKTYLLPEPEYDAFGAEWSACEHGKADYARGRSLKEGADLYMRSWQIYGGHLVDAYEAGWLWAENQDNKEL